MVSIFNNKAKVNQNKALVMADDDEVLCDAEFDAELEGTSMKDAGALCLLTSVCFLGSDRSRLHVFTLS